MNTTTSALDPLAAALQAEEMKVRALASQLRYSNRNDTQTLLDAAELIGCLRRLIAGASVSFADLQRAFGAPGDFGYETPIGDALAQAYRKVMR